MKAGEMELNGDTAVDKQENYGEKFKYNPLWSGPMQQKRSQTDFPFLFSFVGFLLLWTCIVIYGLVVDAKNVKNNTDKLRQSIHGHGMDDAWKPVLAALNTFGFFIIATLLSLMYITLLKWFAKLIVYTTIVIICTLLFSTMCVSSYVYNYDNTQREMLYTAIGSSIIFVITIIYLFVIYKKINIATEVIREASKAVLFFPSSLAFPILSYIFNALLTIYFILGVFPILCNGNCEAEPPGFAYFFVFIHILGFLWVLGFVTGFAQMSLSGSFATWYWTMHKDYVPKYTMLHCMTITARYHLGTIAFGSLVISICRIIRFILNLVKRSFKGRICSISCCVITCCKYFFSNLDKLVKLIDRNAYIMTAMHGTTFMQSTKDVFNLFMRNILKVLVINKVTDGILFLGQLHAIGLTVFIAWGYYYNHESLTENLVAVMICSYFITKCYFMVLKVAIDTTFHCVMEDYERNNGSVNRPYYMSFQLKTLLITEPNDDQAL